MGRALDAAEPWLSTQFTIAADHPALAGHFPGNPVVPGVVLLQRVLSVLSAHLEADQRAVVADAKFVRLLRPGEHCTIAIWRPHQRRFTYECRARLELVARGSLLLEPDA